MKALALVVHVCVGQLETQRQLLPFLSAWLSSPVPCSSASTGQARLISHQVNPN